MIFHPNMASSNRVQSTNGQRLYAISKAKENALSLTFQPDFLSNDCEEFIKQWAVIIVGKNLLLGVLILLHVHNANLQLGFNEDLLGEKKRENEINLSSAHSDARLDFSLI